MTINRKSRKRGGFTLAEMLIVVGIIVVLMGVSFVAVQSYQSSSTRLEFDTIAKEIFIAAQNHLTEAESQGLLSKLDTGSLGYPGNYAEDTINGKQEVYYVLNDGKKDEALNLLLPSYAIDTTVRAGSYVIRYQPSTGTVLDVFYSRPGNPTFLTRSGTTFTDGNYNTLMTGGYRDGGERNRENYGGKVIGWYGGEKPIPTGERLRAPTFEIHNENTLWVKVTDPNTSAQINYNIKLIVKGKLSKAEAYFSIVKKINGAVGKGDGPRLQDNGTDIILDDITEGGMHFAQITPDKGTFIPGEDLIIQAVAYSTDALANVAMSAEKTTNSLFADPVAYKTGAKISGSDIEKHVAGIANFRHFENLDATVSKLGENSTADEFKIETAGQITDLDWQSFNTSEGNIVPISVTVSSGSLLPVTPAYSSNKKIVPLALSYDGQNHKISNVTVNHSGAAGLFGTLADESEVKDLELIDFEVTSTSGSAGALVGMAGATATGVDISNVLAYNDKLTGSDATVTASGSAGGLIGSMSGGKVEKCGAALVVTSTGDAGGLIGTSTGGTVTASYSGGHTIDIIEGDVTRIGYSSENYNVTGATAGGLIGNAGSTTISYSYTTCSASGSTTAGGFVGTASGTISNCYCTGLVSINDGKDNAFIGSGDTTTFEGTSYYYSIVNEVITKDTDGNITDIKYKASGTDSDNVKALDFDTNTYNSFIVGDDDDRASAEPYLDTLKTFYDGKYNLKTVEQLGADISDTDYVATHYGDWPSPEIFVINTVTSSS